MLKNKFYVFLVVLTIFCCFCGAQEKVTVRRAYFDIGSGSTKMTIADVNTVNGNFKVIHECSQPVAYKQDLFANKNGKFSKNICDKGLLVLAKLKWLAWQKGAREFYAAATSAFRSAKNGKKFAKFISKVLNIKVVVITQKQEALMGFFAAVAGQKQAKNNIVVWDIGGASMQITSIDAKGKCQVYYGKLASESFAHHIIKKLQAKDINKVKSANPISKKHMQKAIAYARSIAQKVPASLRKKLQCKNTLVLGIGGVHYYSIRYQVKMGKTYNIDALKNTLWKRVGMTDKQIGGKYARTEVSNLGLVYAFMQELKILKIKVKKVNMGHGIILYPALWK